MGKKKRSRQGDGGKHQGSGGAGAGLPPGVRLAHSLAGHSDYVTIVAFDPQGRTLASGSSDNTVKLWDADSGKRLHTINGHSGPVFSVAFAPQGRTLASGSADGTVTLWDADSGKLLRSLDGHSDVVPDVVLSVAFDPQGRTLASGSDDNTVKLWDADSGKLLRSLDGHSGIVFSVAFAPQGRTLASASTDGTVRLWDADSGKLLRSLDGHSGNVLSVAFAPQGRTLASGSYDNTVKLWNADSGKLLRTLEGHTGSVHAVAFSADGTLLASKSDDHTIRVWHCATWETVAVLPDPTNPRYFISALAFHPDPARPRPLLATAGSEPDTPKDERSRLIHLWELDLDVLTGRRGDVSSVSTEIRSGDSSPATVHHATAKIVLVGDSGVGKTGLGWRLAHGEYREHDSTHGQQFWVLNQLAHTRTDGTQCEAVLWDLAGQPDYRLIHALSIQDADLALVLFDPTDTRDPLGSAEYWLKQLPPECPKTLVAARVDRGHPVLTDEELERFCRQQGISGRWIATSAASGEGLDDLLNRMQTAIPWDDKPAVSTDAVFKRIKDLVLTLKESRRRQRLIHTPAQLRKKLQNQKTKQPAEDSSRKLTDDVLMTAVRHLASQGLIRLLTLSTGEQRILLKPELLNNLAASMVLEARRNPRGLGAVEERRLFDNSYRFRELETLSNDDQALLLDGTITAFLANRLSYRCFRESWGELELLVFPDLMNLKKPERDDLPTEDGPSYILTGSTENVFAALVVMLGYTNLFSRTDQAHDVAWFQSDGDGICGVRQIRDHAECTLVLLFSRDMPDRDRGVFEGLVEQMLDRRQVSVRRLRPVQCQNCGTPVDRAVMTRRLKAGKSQVGCEECCQPVVLPPDEPLSLATDQRQVITHEGAVANQRTRFEEVIYELLRLAQSEKRPAPTCFISYAWGIAAHERWVEKRLATDLEKAGIDVILDRWHAHPGSDLQRFVDRLETADRVLIVGTTNYRRKYDNKDPDKGTVVAAEMNQVSARLLGSEARKETVIPLLLEGDRETSLPPALHTKVPSDFRGDDSYFHTALDLMLCLYGIGARPDEPWRSAVTHWKQKLGGDESGQHVSAPDYDDGELDHRRMKHALEWSGRRALKSAFDRKQSVVIEQDGKLVWLHPDGTTSPYDPDATVQAGRSS